MTLMLCLCEAHFLLRTLPPQAMQSCFLSDDARSHCEVSFLRTKVRRIEIWSSLVSSRGLQQQSSFTLELIEEGKQVTCVFSDSSDEVPAEH